MDEALKIAEYPSRSLYWLAGKLGTSTPSETQCPHSCSACKHRTKLWPHLEKQHPTVFGDVPGRKRRRKLLHGLQAGNPAHVVSLFQQLFRWPRRAQQGGICTLQDQERIFIPGTLGAPGCGPSAGEHQAPEQSRSWNHGIIWARKDPQNHQVQPFPQHCQVHH